MMLHSLCYFLPQLGQFQSTPESGQISSALQLFKNSNLYWIIYSGGYFFKITYICLYLLLI